MVMVIVMVIVNGFYIKFEDISFFSHCSSTIFRLRNVFTTPYGHGHGHGHTQWIVYQI